jgi:hypothetical protein
MAKAVRSDMNAAEYKHAVLGLISTTLVHSRQKKYRFCDRRDERLFIIELLLLSCWGTRHVMDIARVG